ncbi:MAG: TatD family hydrolase [Actinomycetota bacterium]|nr:TatD family hydrolase [Actinomycetota bacterium]
MYFIDTHAHIDMLKELTPEETVKKSEDEGVKYIINVGTTIESSRKSLEFAEKFDNVFASVGVHPHYASGFKDKEIKTLDSLIRGAGGGGRYEKVVAVGETGFDFYRNLSTEADMERAFSSQIELAIKYDVPVIIHDRDAHLKTLEVVKKYAGNKKFRAVVHCFSGDMNFAEKCFELGLYISFTGIVTFPNAGDVLNVVKEVPLERIFIETDSPFLAPQAKRGSENYPGYVKYVAEKIAEIKGLSIEKVAEITSENAENFFSLIKNN